MNILKEPLSPAAAGAEFRSHFVLPNSFDAATALAAAYVVLPRGLVRAGRVLYDTHMWNLWFDGFVLVAADGGIALHERVGEWLGAQRSRLAGVKAAPRFARELPESPLRKQLEKMLGFRALRSVATIRTLRRSIDLQNEAGKTVARVLLEVPAAGKNSASSDYHFAELTALRGYENESAQAAHLLAAMSLPESAAGPLGEGLRVQGVEPVPYLSKPVLRFSPYQPSREVLQEVAVKTLSVARSNEAGIVDDADPEFLHNYRVGLRKIRSILGSLKEVFPEEILTGWKHALAGLGRQTNRLRDLDVYLLARDNLGRLLPSVLQPGLDPFFADLTTARATEQRRVRAFFTQQDYLAGIEDLRNALTAGASLPKSAATDRPIGEAAAERMARRFRKVAKLTRALDARTKDHEIHEIRIQCKKLRYLLEFFGPLFPEEHAEPLSRQLSKLQNRLGRFNDTSVQQAYLLAYWNEHEKRGDTRLAMSLGGLITSLHHEHATLREVVRTSLIEFFCPKNASRVEQILEDALGANTR